MHSKIKKNLLIHKIKLHTVHKIQNLLDKTANTNGLRGLFSIHAWFLIYIHRAFNVTCKGSLLIYSTNSLRLKGQKITQIETVLVEIKVGH